MELRVYIQRQGVKGQFDRRGFNEYSGRFVKYWNGPRAWPVLSGNDPRQRLECKHAVLCNNVSRKHTNCSYSRVTTFSHLRIHTLCRKFFVNWSKNRFWSPHSSPFLNHINFLINHSPQSLDFGFQEQTLLEFNSLVDTTITSAGWTRTPGWEILRFLQYFSLSLGNPGEEHKVGLVQCAQLL